MTSKEALDKIISSFNETIPGINGLGEVVVDNCLIRCNKAELEIIQKDLERLEKLEKAIEIIIRSKIKPSAFIAGLENYRSVYDEEMPFNKAIYLLDLDCSEEEYELLKEVLNNGN